MAQGQCAYRVCAGWCASACPPAHSAGITIQCCARACAYVRVGIDGGGDVDGGRDAIPIPIPILVVFLSNLLV